MISFFDDDSIISDCWSHQANVQHSSGLGRGTHSTQIGKGWSTPWRKQLFQATLKSFGLIDSCKNNLRATDPIEAGHISMAHLYFGWWGRLIRRIHMQESRWHFHVVSLLRIEIMGEHSQLDIVSESHPGFAAVAFECEKFHHPKVPPKRITANYPPGLGTSISHPRWALLSRRFSQLPQVGYVSFLEGSG